METPFEIARAPAGFLAWSELLHLLQTAFASMEGRIDPPSSMLQLTAASLATKSREESLFLATEAHALVGCVFARERGDVLYVSKLAVRPERQRCGIGRGLMDAAEESARELGIPALELDTRIELIENHATFAAMGYTKIAEHAHAGYDRATFITMRKQLTEQHH